MMTQKIGIKTMIYNYDNNSYEMRMKCEKLWI